MEPVAARVNSDRAESDAGLHEVMRPMREYAELIPEPGVGALRFDDFPFQVEWYSEEIANAEEVVWRKSTQVGMSAYVWRWAVRQSDQFGQTGLYIFPTETHVREFGDERIEPAIEASRYLSSRILKRFVHTKALKRIGRGFLHLRGSNSKAGAQSVAAQFIVFDEYDHLDPVNLPQIERRISGARQLGQTPRIRRLGTPTVDGTGISAAFEDSDQRDWMVTCPGCGEVQGLDWNQNVRWRNTPGGEVMRPGRDEFEDRKHVEEAWRACRVCEAPLNVAEGSWMPQVPGRKVIGYQVSRLIVPNTDLRQIIVASRQSKVSELEAFHNNDLGMPWSPAEAALDVASILAAAALGLDCPRDPRGYYGSNPVTMGVDVAGERDLNVRISEQLPAEHRDVANPRRALWVGTVDSFEKVVGLMHSYRVQVCAVDANPERRMAKSLRAEFPGRVILVEYDHRYESDAIKVTDTGPVGTPLEGVPLKVRLNRTEAIDAMMDSIRCARNRPPQHPSQLYIDHLRALKRRTEVSPDGKVTRRYETTGTAGDDFAHAEVYDLAATEMLRVRMGIQGAQERQTPLPDEDLGFRRMQLAGDDVNDRYTAGFGE